MTYGYLGMGLTAGVGCIFGGRRRVLGITRVGALSTQ